MEQHPIPQQISSYQFRLVGDMTLKQFFQLAGGFVVALIFYSAPLIGIVKWPFVITSAVLGIALAFLPLEERPLERWIFAFFRAIYSPTLYFWKKTSVLPKVFQDEPVGESAPQDAALKEYLTSTVAAPKTGPLAKLEGAEQGFLATLTGMFTSIIPGQATPGQPASAPAGAVDGQKKEMKIPTAEPVRVIQPTTAHVVVEEKPKSPDITAPNVTTHEVAPIVAGDEIISTKQAIFSVDAAPPNPPTTPNVIVGQVVDQDRRIVEGAIMEIKDEQGRPIRALKSNKAGHFITVTQLDTGRYTLLTEKEGYEFSPVSFDANGALIPPILVQGKRNIEPPLMNVPHVPPSQYYSIN